MEDRIAVRSSEAVPSRARHCRAFEPFHVSAPQHPRSPISLASTAPGLIRHACHRYARPQTGNHDHAVELRPWHSEALTSNRSCLVWSRASGAGFKRLRIDAPP